jgi:hypothetical protein
MDHLSMTQPRPNGSGMAIELPLPERLALYRARDTFARCLNSLRLRHSLTPGELANRAWLSLSRVKQLLSAEAFPAWDEALLFAYILKVPATSLAGSLILACDQSESPIFRECSAPLSGAHKRPLECARKVYLLQKLASHQAHLLDIPLTGWPALLPPTLADALASESAVIRVNATLIGGCLDVVGQRRAPFSPAEPPAGSARLTLGESLDAALDATAGAEERLHALTHRHRLDDASLTRAVPIEIASDLRTTLAEIQRPLTLLRDFKKADSIDEREARVDALLDLIPSLAKDHDDIVPTDAPRYLANLSPQDHTDALRMLTEASLSLLSISDKLQDLSTLAAPPTTPRH